MYVYTLVESTPRLTDSANLLQYCMNGRGCAGQSGHKDMRIYTYPVYIEQLLGISACVSVRHKQADTETENVDLAGCITLGL